MALLERSSFIYGHLITDDNQYINFTENGIDELVATVEVGAYTIIQFADAVAAAFNAIGDNNYLVSVDLETRLLKVTSDNNFDMLVTGGTQAQISAYGLMGFTTDRSASFEYEGDIASGFIYLPQTKLYKYSPFENNNSSVQSKVNESSAGEIELVTYGSRRFAKFNIKYITDITGQNFVEDNANALQDVNDFMDYIRLKRPFLFMPDRDNTTNNYSSILEKTGQSSDGTKYELRELYAEKLAYYYETGTITIRQI